MGKVIPCRGATVVHRASALGRGLVSALICIQYCVSLCELLGPSYVSARVHGFFLPLSSRWCRVFRACTIFLPPPFDPCTLPFRLPASSRPLPRHPNQNPIHHSHEERKDATYQQDHTSTYSTADAYVVGGGYGRSLSRPWRLGGLLSCVISLREGVSECLACWETGVDTFFRHRASHRLRSWWRILGGGDRDGDGE